MEDVFQKIIDREIPTDILYENEHVIAFKDIYPKAPIHLLIVVKKPIPDLQSVAAGDLFLVQEVVKAAQILAKEYGIEKNYRLVTNNGTEAGQTIFHLHFHLLAGKRLGAEG